ncbi:barstar family protein [Lachnospiraceae bacterium OttesenSCG-928-E19]|nr:barstar family protein [Lachnospiraceae bacterium OttesenSCG-928-E19]
MLNYLHFVDNISDLKMSDNSILFKLDAAHCDTKQNLFKYFALQLSFPYYFGHNWDAFNECIHDLEWIKDETGKNKVYIYIYNLSELLKNDIDKNKETFFQIINTEDVYIDEFNNPVEINFVFNNKERQFYIDDKFK